MKVHQRQISALSTTSEPAPTPAAEPKNELVVGLAPAYHVLAQTQIGPMAQRVQTLLAAVDKNAMPDADSLYALRKSLLVLRNQLDIFVYAFRGDLQLWGKVRDQLDAGYENIGKFKDLYDAQNLGTITRDQATGQVTSGTKKAATYDPKELADRRGVVMEWKETFAKDLQKGDVRDLLAQAEPLKKNADLPVKLSKFYWGGAGVSPKRKRSGIENVRILANAQIKVARKALNALHDLPKIKGEHAEEQFHDTRKRLRAVVNTLDAFPDLGKNAPKQPLVDLINRFGQIEDKITGLVLARERGDEAAKKKLKAEIGDAWDVLRAELDDSALIDLRTALNDRG